MRKLYFNKRAPWGQGGAGLPLSLHGSADIGEYPAAWDLSGWDASVGLGPELTRLD